MTQPKALNLAEIHVETLVFLHEFSPVWCGDFPSKKARDELEEAGYAKAIPLKGQYGYWVLTEEGFTALKGVFSHIDEALQARIAQLHSEIAVRKASHLGLKETSDKKFTVQVSGQTGTGKSVLMFFIKKALHAAGFTNIKLSGMVEQGEDFEHRIPALREKEADVLTAAIDLIEMNLGAPDMGEAPAQSSIVPRYITMFQVPGEDTSLQVYASDLPGEDGDNHRYEIQGFNTQNNPSEYEGSLHHQTSIIFQNGRPEIVGINGITMESLLAICIDRLLHLQSGRYPCAENQEAWAHLALALGALKRRTEKMVAFVNNKGGC